MLTGNGRHRRPRQAPALVVAAGVTSSAIVIPLLGATAANAADATTWDRVADCESGGSWSASPGNGYYGGLQISQQDWDKYGGDTYATTPDQASRSQQIAVAEKILADQGTTPWATCALLSGLTVKSGSVSVDTGVGSGDSSGNSDSANGSGSGGASGSADSKGSTGSTGSGDSKGASGSTDQGDSSGILDSSGTSGSSGLSDSPPDPESSLGSVLGASPSNSPSSTPTAGHGGADGRAGSTGSPESASPDPSSSPGSGGSLTEAPASGDTDNSVQSVGSWSLVDTGSLDGGGRHRGGSADESAATGTTGHAAGQSGRHAYTVRAGDTLGSIADSLGLDGGWHALYAANENVIGSDPNHIVPGQRLEIHAETGAR
jgi:resuscitation-promoting factor RpfA